MPSPPVRKYNIAAPYSIPASTFSLILSAQKSITFAKRRPQVWSIEKSQKQKWFFSYVRKYRVNGRKYGVDVCKYGVNICKYGVNICKYGVSHLASLECCVVSKLVGKQQAEIAPFFAVK